MTELTVAEQQRANELLAALEKAEALARENGKTTASVTGITEDYTSPVVKSVVAAANDWYRGEVSSYMTTHSDTTILLRLGYTEPAICSQY